MAQPRIRLFAVGFSCLDLAVKLRTGRRPSGRGTEEPVLSPDDKRADGTLGCVVVDRQIAVLDVAFQLAPIAGQIPNAAGYSLACNDAQTQTRTTPPVRSSEVPTT